MTTHDEVALAHANAMSSPLYEQIAVTIRRRFDLPEARSGPELARFALHRGGTAVGPWGAAFSMEVVLALFATGRPRGEMSVLLGGFRSLEEEERGTHGRARTIIQTHAETTWRARNPDRIGARTAFHPAELKIVSHNGARFGTVGNVFEGEGTIDYGLCAIDDPFLWSIRCVAESEMRTFRPGDEEAVRDLRKLFDVPSPFRLYICRASNRGAHDAAFRAVVGRVVAEEARKPDVRVGDEFVALMVVADGGDGQAHPWSGIVRHSENPADAQIEWRELGGER